MRKIIGYNLNKEIVEDIIFNDKPFYMMLKNGEEVFGALMGEQKIYLYEIKNSIVNSNNCLAVITGNDLLKLRDDIEQIEIA